MRDRRDRADSAPAPLPGTHHQGRPGRRLRRALPDISGVPARPRLRRRRRASSHAGRGTRALGLRAPSAPTAPRTASRRGLPARSRAGHRVRGAGGEVRRLPTGSARLSSSRNTSPSSKSASASDFRRAWAHSPLSGRSSRWSLARPTGEEEILPFRAFFRQGGGKYLEACVQQGGVDLVADSLRGHRLCEP